MRPGWRRPDCVPLRRAALIRSPQILPSITLDETQVGRETAGQRPSLTQEDREGQGYQSVSQWR